MAKKPRDFRNSNASEAVLPGSGGNRAMTKLATLGLTVSPSAESSRVSHGSQMSLCSRARSVAATSSSAATAAACAAALRLKGLRTRFSTSATGALR